MADFEAAAEFAGSREGFFYGVGPEGLGYYRDQGPNKNAAGAEPAAPGVDGEEKQDGGGGAAADSDDEDAAAGAAGGGVPGELHLDPLEDPDDPDTRGKTYQTDSLCMNCHEQGQTTFYLTEVPHFREIIISAFRCPHCNYADTMVQPNSDIPTHGVRYKLSVTTPQDLNRQVVKSANCAITIPELGFVIPRESQASQLTTVEGLLQKATVALHDSNDARREVDPEAADKVADFVAQLALLTAGAVGEDGVLLVRPFTLLVEDPSGDSHVQGLAAAAGEGDPQLHEERYVRSALENKQLGLFTNEDLGVDAAAPSPPAAQGGGPLPYEAPQGGTLTDDRIMSMYQKAEDLDLVRFACACPACGSKGENRMCTVTVPHFREIILMCFVCDACGFKEAEVKSGGAVPAQGRVLTLSATAETAAFDLKRDVVKSATSGVCIPEIGLEIMPGTLGGRYITVEGIIRLTVEQLTASQQDFLVGDSATPENRSKFAEFFAECRELLAGRRAFTFELRDPLAASWIYNPHAPDPDPQLAEELYTRSEEEESDLGLDKMNAPEDGHMEGTQSPAEQRADAAEVAAATAAGVAPAGAALANAAAGGAAKVGGEQAGAAGEER